MFLLPLAFYGAIALTVWFVLASEAAAKVKVVLAALFILSVWLRHSRFALAGFFLQIALSIFILLYQKTQAR